MKSGVLGKIYKDTEIIIKQGEPGDSMYIIQKGLVEIVSETDRGEVHLAIRGEGEFFGEMAIFEREVRSATVRALGEARVLTIDKKNFLRRVYEDPSLAFRMVQTMSSRIRELSNEISDLRIKLDEQSDLLNPRSDLNQDKDLNHAGADLIVIASGSALRPGETISDLLERSAGILGTMVPQVIRCRGEVKESPDMICTSFHYGSENE